MTERRSKGRGAAVGVAAALVAAGLAVTALNDSDAVPPTTAVAEATMPPAAAEEARGLTGRVVLRTSYGATVLDLATGVATPVPVPDLVVRVVPAGGSVVVLTERSGHEPAPAYVLAPDLSLTPLPAAYAAVADEAGTGVWLTPGETSSAVTRYALDGRRLSEPVALPEGMSLAGTYRGGFVLTDLRDVVLWDPERRREVARHDAVERLGVAGGRAAWTGAGCTGDCVVAWADLPGGFGTPRRAASGAPLTYGSLSADGRWLAARHREADETFVVCDLDGGRCVQPPGAASGSRAFGWSDGTLVATGAGAGRLVAWRPGWDTFRQLPGAYEHVTDLAALGS